MLTEENCDEVILVEQLFQHPSVDLLDLVPELEDVLAGEPGEHALAVKEVAVVRHRHLAAEVEKG